MKAKSAATIPKTIGTIDLTGQLVKDTLALNTELVEALELAIQQIEYLHLKFTETGSGNATLTRIESVIRKAKGEL